MEHRNPFDDPELDCHILINDLQQYSLWPAFSAIPAGWRSVFGPQPREACNGWLAQHWHEPTQVGSRRHV